MDDDEDLKNTLLKLAASMDALADSLRETPTRKTALARDFDIGNVDGASSPGADPLTDFLLS